MISLLGPIEAALVQLGFAPLLLLFCHGVINLVKIFIFRIFPSEKANFQKLLKDWRFA